MANWYSYNFGDPSLPGSYRKTTLPPSCTDGSTICAVYLDDTSTIPGSLSFSDVTQYIANAQATLTPQPEGNPFFVYLKSL